MTDLSTFLRHGRNLVLVAAADEVALREVDGGGGGNLSSGNPRCARAPFDARRAEREIGRERGERERERKREREREAGRDATDI